MTFELVHTVIHGFTKEAHSSVSEIVKKDVLLNNNLPAVQSLVSSLSKLIGKPGNTASYGQFNDDQRQGPFPANFKEFVSDVSDKTAFLKLSHIAVDELVTEAEKEAFATGGHILVSHFTSDSAPFFLVAMIKQRDGVVLDKDYVPVEITEMDLSKIHQAARINLNSYFEAHNLQSEPNVDDENKDQTYLCFLGNSKNSQASAYFITALGCTKGIASSRATKNAIDGIAKYFKKAELKKYKNRARDAVISYLQRQLIANQNATVEDICNAAVSSLLAEDRFYANDIWEVLNSEISKVPSQFVVNESTLKSKMTIKSESDSWSLQFEHQILGADSSSVFYYNKEEKTLTITELNEKLIETIETELESRYIEG